MEPCEAEFNWSAPDYAAVFRERMRRLEWLRSGSPKERAAKLHSARAHYADNIADFISAWAITVDPRNVSKRDKDGNRLPVVLPFLLMPKQRELVNWMLERLATGTPGVLEKSRDVGASWLAVSILCTLCLFRSDFMAGLGSAKEDKLDRSADPDTLFWKARHFLTHLPPEFTGGWDAKKNSAHLRIAFPLTGSSITGEAGDNIGRGGRKAIYCLDEAAHIERPKLIDAALAANTDCRIDMSSVAGMANSFAERRHSGKISVFTFHYRDDLRKPANFRQLRLDAGDDPAVFDQEYELDYSGMMDGQIIAARLVSAAVDAHIKLGLKPTGDKRSSFDVADQGRDKNAWGWAYGWLLMGAEEWSGAGKDILDSVYRVFDLCDANGLPYVVYDADGMGAPAVEPAARVANKARTDAKRKPVRVQAYRSSAPVMWPEQRVPGAGDRKNEDMFQNFGAQAMWALKRRFEETERALAGRPYDPEGIISIAGPLTYQALGVPDTFKARNKLAVELSQPTWKKSETGKLKVDKVPDGASSPNLADMARMLFAPRNVGLQIREGAADALLRGG